MGVLTSTQPVAMLGSSFILTSFDMACTCRVPVGWYANPCAVLGFAVLCYGDGVGVGVMCYDTAMVLGLGSCASVGAVLSRSLRGVYQKT